MKSTYFLKLLFIVSILPLIGCNIHSGPPRKPAITIASTTSILDCGIYDLIQGTFEKKYNCKVKLIAVGSGQAIRLGRDGNADVLLVHDKDEEEKFITEGYGIKRVEFMRNDFIIVGPLNDPAGIKNMPPLDALKKIAEASFSKRNVLFVSRGDNSGTHKRELSLWEKGGLRPSVAKYIETGSGMETTLRIADEKKAYTLTDRATYITHKKEFSTLELLVESDGRYMHNPYSIIVISPQKYPHTNVSLSQKFIEFLTKEEGREIIKNFGVGPDGKGEALFTLIQD